MVLSFHRATLKVGAQELRDATGLQETVSPASLATVLDARGGDSRAQALEAGARRVELLERISGRLPLPRRRPPSFPSSTNRSERREGWGARPTKAQKRVKNINAEIAQLTI